MRKIAFTVVVVLLGAPCSTLAQDRWTSNVTSHEFDQLLDEHSAVPVVGGSLTTAAGSAWLVDSRTLARQQTQVQQPRHRLRRAVLLGTAIGAAGGLVLAASMAACGDASGEGYCPLAALAGAGVGAGLGAATGLIVGRADWVKRHPVLFATALGAAAGYLGGWAACPAIPPYNDHYSCRVRGLTYAGLGAGVGTGVGLIVARARR